jgi:glycosyltransferase involved in cell wall biosynthesis
MSAGVNPGISVIIPTTCVSQRSGQLLRAVESVVRQAKVAPELLVVVNGTRCDEALLRDLRTDSRVRVVQLSEANVSIARYVGVREARGELFSFLDDDDELLDGALQTRVGLLRTQPATDVLVTNGFLNSDGRDKPLVAPSLEHEIAEDPAGALLKQNWFASPASTFRSASIDKELFNLRDKYFEWTYLFFVLLAHRKRFHYSSELTYRKNETGHDNASKSVEYMRAGPESLVRLHELPLEQGVRKGLQKKYQAALHSLSAFELENGRRWSAWKLHIKCLAHGGYVYLSYTRRLVSWVTAGPGTRP